MPTGAESLADVAVIGATGSFGAAAAIELLSRGEPVRLFVRDLERARRRFGNRANATYVVGDADDDGAMRGVMAGCRGVVVGLGGVDEGARAARLLSLYGEAGGNQQAGKSLVMPVYQADAEAVLTDPAILQAARRAGVRVGLLPIGPLFGPTVRGWVIDSMCRAALEWKTIPVLGGMDAPASWTYAPDAARVAADALKECRTEAEEWAGVVGLDCPVVESTHRTFAEAIGAAAIRLTTPPGASSGGATAAVAEMSSFRKRLAGMMSREAKSAIARFEQAVGARVGGGNVRSSPNQRSNEASTPLEVAVRMTVTSYRQGANRP